MEPNAFAPEFLDHFAEHDEPATSLEASTAGPWRVIALRAATHLLDRTCSCVELLLSEAERLKPEACSKPAKRLA